MPEEPAQAVGIDLGTTNSMIATMAGGQPAVLPNSAGGRSTPSVVAFPEPGVRLIGAAARRQALLDPRDTVDAAKRLIGRRYDDVAEEAQAFGFTVVPGPEGAACCAVRGVRYAPEDINAMVLGTLADEAARYLGTRVGPAVLSVPAHFDDAAREATRDAGRRAGLDVLCLIDEPVAAALAYRMDQGIREIILVFDLGGGTCEASVLDVGGGTVSIRASAADPYLGGTDFDRRLVDHLVDEFRRDQGIDLCTVPLARQRLYEVAERAKDELSATPQTRVSMPFAMATGSGPRHLDVTITRATFERLCADLVERCRAVVRQAMIEAATSSADIGEVILAGGASRIPAVRRVVRQMAGGTEPNLAVNPDEVVALGAAVEAAVLTGPKPHVAPDVTPLALGLPAHGGGPPMVLERDTTIPVRRSEVLATGDREEDAGRRRLADARNGLESMAAHVERQLSELGELAPVHEKARAELLLGDARIALGQQAPLDRLATLLGELQRVARGLHAGVAGPAGIGAPAGDDPSDPDVIDADIAPG